MSEKEKLMLFIEGTSFNTKLFALFWSKSAYTPIGNSPKTINAWNEDYDIILCTFRRFNLSLVRKALKFYGVRYSSLEHRQIFESYTDVVKRVHPDILVEDDCESIGGEFKTCIYAVPESLRSGIRSIVIKEFCGIDDINPRMIT